MEHHTVLNLHETETVENHDAVAINDHASDFKGHQMTEMAMINPHSMANESVDLKEMLRQIELSYIQNALEQSKGVVAHAAQKLGLRRTTLVEKMKKYKVSRVS